MALAISRRLDDGVLDLAALEGLVQDIADDAAAGRARRLAGPFFLTRRRAGNNCQSTLQVLVELVRDGKVTARRFSPLSGKADVVLCDPGK
jgi:hypothetical protein